MYQGKNPDQNYGMDNKPANGKAAKLKAVMKRHYAKCLKRGLSPEMAKRSMLQKAKIIAYNDKDGDTG